MTMAAQCQRHKCFGLWLLILMLFSVYYANAECNIEDLGELLNGEYIPSSGDGSSLAVGEKVSVICNTGYTSGCNTFTCEEDGTFHPSAECFCLDFNECQIETGYSYSLDYSYSSDTNNNPHEEQGPPLANCHENAVCVNTIGSFVCQCNGDFVGDGVNTCEYDPPSCELLSAPKDGYIRMNTSVTTMFRCNEGYKLQGSSTRKCTRDGWNGVQPTCITTRCEYPVVPANGFKIGDSYELGSRVKFGCNPGFILEGSDSRVCVAEKSWNGRGKKRWSGWTPVCKPPKTLNDIASDMRRDFIDKYELYTDSSKGRSAMGRLSRGNSVGLDLVFAFDKSSSVGRRNFQKGLNFTKYLIEEFGVNHTSYGGTRVAAVSFANEGYIEFNYDDDVDTKEKVFRKLDDMEGTLGGGTAMDAALAKVRIDIVPQMRNNSKRALFIVTDGHANTVDPEIVAQNLKEKQQFEIFAIGIGSDVDREQIRKVASKPYTSHVFLINSFDDLAEITGTIAEKRTDYTRCGIAGDWELPEDTNKANPHAWPWIAQVFREPYGFYCEGALICEQWVVLPASCLDGNSNHDQEYDNETVPIYKLNVKLGIYDITENTDGEGCGQNAAVEEIHRHDDYSIDSLDSDIALLKLDHPLQLVNCIRTICLPQKADSFNFRPGKDEDNCFQAGWGSADLWQQQKSNNTGNNIARIPHDIPRQVTLPLVENSKCEKYADGDVDLTENIVCAGERVKSELAEECTGQQGSPLVCKRDDDSWAMMGVLSDGSRCSTSLYGYSFFTKVHNYIDWINEVTDNCNERHVVYPVGGFH